MHYEEKERDTFPSTYAKTYIWHKTQPELYISAGFDAFALTKDEKKAFIDLNAVKELPWDEQLQIIRNLYAQRMKTTYYVYHCENLKNKMSSEHDIDSTHQDTLLDVADKVYSEKTQKVLQPLPTARRVLGYCRPAYYYTGHSEYQGEYSKLGYERLIPSRDLRLKQRLPFCDQFKSRH
uniref:Uncharacterized protein n=1 Tax=Cuerna arida TaxID=1464854 RepID=A0A1B6FYH9_9HEMI